MSAKEEAGLIMRGVGEGLKSIIFPPKTDEKPSETITLHYCEKCKRYHKAE